MDQPGKFSLAECVHQYGRFFFWQTARVLGLLPNQHAQSDQERDQIGEFTELASCCICGEDDNHERFITDDGMRIVECDECSHLYTSPRISEEKWIEYLKSDTKRSREFTENRLKYGRALPSKTKMTSPRWYQERKQNRWGILNHISDYIEPPTTDLKRLHDVGSGVGFTLLTARDQGIEVTGNELNGPAVEAMREQFGLSVFNKRFSECPLDKGSVDAVTMRDFIEHAYHPDKEVEMAYRTLSPGGILWLKTFHTDCHAFDENKKSWEYLFWNHTNHFSDDALKRLVTNSGFNIIEYDGGYDDVAVSVFAQKPVNA